MKSKQQYKANVKIVSYIDIDAIYDDIEDRFVDNDATNIADKITKAARMEDSSAVVFIDDIEMIAV